MRKSIHSLLFVFIVSLVPPMAQAQDTLEILSLEEALTRTLSNNSDIYVARNEALQAESEATPGNAGLLPNLYLSGSYQRQLQDSRNRIDVDQLGGGESSPDTTANQQPSRDPVNTFDNAQTKTYSASVNLSYNIFGGFNKYNRYQSLKNLSQTGDVQARLTIEATLINLVNTYLEAARLSETYSINQQALDISRERLRRARTRYEFGQSTKLEVLNARVDLNSDSITLAQTLRDLQNAKRTICVLIGREVRANFLVEDDFDLNKDLTLEPVMTAAMQSNASLVLSELQRQNAEIGIGTARSGQFPTLDLSASYGYNRTESEASILAYQQSWGFTGGVTLRYYIFQGGQNNIAVQNAKLELENNRERLDLARKKVSRDVRNAYNNYSTSLFLLELASGDLETAELNFDRSQEAYQSGQITSTDLRTAQLNLIRVLNRINNLRIQTKASEAQLYRLAGWLITEDLEELE